MPFFRTILVASIVLSASGCVNEKHIEAIILDAFPNGVEVEVTASCTHILGPAVALFSYEGTEPDMTAKYQAFNGIWTHSESLGKFAELSDSNVRGPGVGSTILDGKNCLRDMTENANEILFYPNHGHYFRSNNRKILIILPEATPSEGILFVQAP